MRAAKLSTHTRGSSAPLGATVSRDGVNFSMYSRHATGIEIVLFDGVGDGIGADLSVDVSRA
jgi:pullulanase/glycogen debranching enzyme